MTHDRTRDEQFPDDERQAICTALVVAASRARSTEQYHLLMRAFKKATGTDTVLIARRAHPSETPDA